MRDGKSDAEVRLELLDEGLSQPEIAAAMLSAAGPSNVRWSWLVVGAGIFGLALVLYVHHANFVARDGSTDWRPYGFFGAIGLAFMARALFR